MQRSTHYCSTCDLSDGPVVFVGRLSHDYDDVTCEDCGTSVDFDMRED